MSGQGTGSLLQEPDAGSGRGGTRILTCVIVWTRFRASRQIRPRVLVLSARSKRLSYRLSHPELAWGMIVLSHDISV